MHDDYRGRNRRAERRSANAMWGWIAGAVFLVVVLAIIFGLGGRDYRPGEGAGVPKSSSQSGK